MATTKKAETKTTKAATQPPKTEAVKLEEEYVEITIPVDYTTDEEMLYLTMHISRITDRKVVTVG